MTYCHSQRICRTCKERGKETDFLQLCRMAAQGVSRLLKNALDAGEIRTVRLYTQSPSCVKQ